MTEDNIAECKACGKCCQKHWLLRLKSKQEFALFDESQIAYGSFIWTDLCPYLKDGRCTIHKNKPSGCRDYFCEGRFSKED